MKNNDTIETIISFFVTIPTLEQLDHQTQDSDFCLRISNLLLEEGIEYTQEIHNLVLEEVGKKLYVLHGPQFKWTKNQETNLVEFMSNRE